MSTDTLEVVDLNLIFKDVPECISENCGNEAKYIQKHDQCMCLKCESCMWAAKESLREAGLEASIGMLSVLVCVYCNTQKVVSYWEEHLHFIPL